MHVNVVSEIVDVIDIDEHPGTGDLGYWKMRWPFLEVDAFKIDQHIQGVGYRFHGTGGLYVRESPFYAAIKKSNPPF